MVVLAESEAWLRLEGRGRPFGESEGQTRAKDRASPCTLKMAEGDVGIQPWEEMT